MLHDSSTSIHGHTMPSSHGIGGLWTASTGLFRFAYRTLCELANPAWNLAETSRQINEIGWRFVPLILVAGIVVGIVVSELIWTALVNFGAVDTVIPAELSRTIFRQLGPLMTGLLVSGRVGAAIGAELAVLRLTEQIDALESLAIHSFRHLVLTRVIACMIALPILTTLMNFALIAGGFLWEAINSEMTLRLYVSRVFDRTGWEDYLLPTLTTAIVGFAIGTISCYFGYTVEENAVGVRRASMNSVVVSSLFVILLNVILNEVMFVSFPAGVQ